MNNINGNKSLFWIIIILILINVGLITSIWVTNGNHHPPPPRGFDGGNPHNKDNFLIHELELNKDQAEKFMQLKEDQKKYTDNILEHIRILKDSLFDGGIDSTSAINIAAKIGNLQMKIELQTYRHFRSVDSILNNEQKEKFNEMKHGMLRQMFPPPPPPPKPKN